ncbi:MAG TPA: ABC transporter permease [Micromonosporaceae bacterium]|jgi:ABC-type transport system involved in multi-copper enzyme maturation permease subunit
MTTVALRADLPPAAGRAGFGGALRSEWTKLVSLRSTVATLLSTMAVTIGLSALVAWGASNRLHHVGRIPESFDAVQASMFGLIFGQLVIAVIGAMTITGEYSTGMIRTSLAAAPRRLVTLAAKLTVFAGAALLTGLVCAFASFFIGQHFYASLHISVGLGEPNVLRAVVGGALFLTVAGLLSFGLGTILRHTAGAITAAVGILFISFILFQFLPSDWAEHAQRWIPFFAGSSIWSTQPDPEAHVWGPWAEFAVFSGYALVALAVGAIMFRRRDA